MGHAHESIAQGVAFGTRYDFDGQIAFGYGHGDAGHFLQISNHIVEGSGQGANFVVAVNINVLIEIARVADFPRNGDEMGERLGDGLGRQECDETTSEKCKESTAGCNPSAEGAHAARRFRGFLKKLGDIGVALVENDR